MDESNATSESSKAASESHECKVCNESFESVHAVLKHELISHSGGKNLKKQPINQLKRRVNAVLKSINCDDEKKARQELAELIADCAQGRELDVIFKLHRVDNEKLDCIYSRVYNCLQEELSRIGQFIIEEYGSIANGLALKTSDIDLHITCLVPGADPNIVYKSITKMLYRSWNFSDVHPIRKARVPIIKCVHKATGFSLDINTTEPYGVHNSQFIRQLNECDARIHQLMLFLKIWAKKMHIYGAFNMTNYCLITLVIFFLQNNDPPVLSSVKILQRNAPNVYVNGINFGMNTRGIPMDSSQNVHQLIKGFFKFYHDYDFENLIIAPHLGKAIKRTAFQSGAFKYPEYEAHLRLFATEEGSVEELQIDRPVCIQDMFCLNVNVGKCLSETNLEYFRKCLTLAHNKCSEQKTSLKNLYTSLLVRMVTEIHGMFPQEPAPPVEEKGPANGTDSGLSLDILPRKNELKMLARFVDDPLELQKLWAKEYIDGIVQIISEVYRIDMTLLSPTQSNKCKKIEQSDKDAIPPPSKWSISGSVDLWSGRQMQRNTSTPFMQYQLEQTKKLHAERRQNSSFAVQFKGILTISILKTHSALRLEASSPEQLCKNHPFRKFFNALKCIVQNYNLKQRIYDLDKRTRNDKLS